MTGVSAVVNTGPVMAKAVMFCQHFWMIINILSSSADKPLFAQQEQLNLI